MKRDEAMACIKVLVAVMKADGNVDAGERRSLGNAVRALGVPSGVDVDELLQEEIDVGAELRKLTSRAARDHVFRSSYFMVHADGTKDAGEMALLDRIARETDAPAELRAHLDRMFAGTANVKLAAFAQALAGLTSVAAED